MKLAKYPPEIKGHTVSNLILVEVFEIEKNRAYVKGSGYDGFTMIHNSKDVFLNVNAIPKNASVKRLTKLIIHETFHNVLTKYVDETSSSQLDNLFDQTKYVKKMLKLFGLKPSKKNPIRVDTDFWLSGSVK